LTSFAALPSHSLLRKQSDARGRRCRRRPSIFSSYTKQRRDRSPRRPLPVDVYPLPNALSKTERLSTPLQKAPIKWQSQCIARNVRYQRFLRFTISGGHHSCFLLRKPVSRFSNPARLFLPDIVQSNHVREEVATRSRVDTGLMPLSLFHQRRDLPGIWASQIPAQHMKGWAMTI